MASYEPWQSSEKSSGGTNSLLTWARSFVAQYPIGSFLLLLWIFTVPPVGWAAQTWAHSLEAQTLAAAVSDRVPMIQRMARYSSDPAWIRFALSAIWAMGPVLTAVTVLLCVRGHRRGWFLAPPDSPASVFGIFLTVGVFLLLIATAEPLGRSFTTLVWLFSTGWGLFTLGWLIILFNFIGIGILVAYVILRMVASDA